MGNVEVLPSAEDFPYDDPPEVIGAPEAGPRKIEASDTSSMGSLRDRLRQAKEERRLPKWVLAPDEGTPGILVEYRPIDWEELEAIRKANGKGKGRKADTAALLTACDILIRCCLGIYTAHDDDPDERDEWRPLTTDEPTTYGSPELSAFLSDPTRGVEVRTARQAVRGLYATDGDVMAAADEVVKFSGYLGEDEARPN